MKKNLLLALAFFCLSLNAQTTFKVGPLEFTTTGTTTVDLSDADSKNAAGEKITSYVVPATVQHEGVTYTVTAIGEYAFRWNDLTSIELPETIEAIKFGAFNSTPNLQAITLPKGLKILDDYAFNGCGITTIEIPDGVERIGESAFFTAKSLESIKFGAGVKEIGKSAFYKTALTEITLPEAVVSLADGVFYSCSKLKKVTLSSKTTELGKRAFRECTSLTDVNIPSTVQSIGEDCFLQCTSLTNITIPASLTELGSCAFSYTGVNMFNVDPNNKNFKAVDGVIFNADGTLLLAGRMKGAEKYNVPDDCIGIAGGAFWGSDIQEIVMPEGLLAIDNYAFCQSALATVTFPKSLVYIGVQGFAGTQLTEVTLPENMPVLYDEAFASSQQLTTVTIPSGVKTIGPMAFRNCKNLTTVKCLGSEAPEPYFYEPYEFPFFDIADGATVYVPKGTKDSYESAGYTAFMNVEETEKGVFKHTATTPSTGATVTPGWMDMKFDVTFAEPVTIINSNPSAFLRVGALTSGVLKQPYGSWNATKGDDENTVRIWGDDGDHYMDVIKTENGKEYFMVIPAGVVKNAAGEENEQIVISFKSEEVNGIEGTEGSTNATEVARYNMSGQKIDSAQPGVNIVKMSDGTVRKVIVK